MRRVFKLIDRTDTIIDKVDIHCTVSIREHIDPLSGVLTYLVPWVAYDRIKDTVHTQCRSKKAVPRQLDSVQYAEKIILITSRSAFIGHGHIPADTYFLYHPYTSIFIYSLPEKARRFSHKIIALWRKEKKNRSSSRHRATCYMEPLDNTSTQKATAVWLGAVG